MKRVAIAVFLATISSAASAQLAIGTWIKRPSASPPMMMVIEPAGPGVKITYRMLGPNGAPVDQKAVTIVTALDGKESPVMIDGKETGQTMATQRIDPYHSSTIIRMQGKLFGTSKAELSPDGKTLTVENDMSALDPSVGKQTEYWDRR